MSFKNDVLFEQTFNQISKRYSLKFFLLKPDSDQPIISSTAQFKYTYSENDGELYDHFEALKKSSDRVIACCKLDGFIIGYTVALLKEKDSFIDVLDIDERYRRRCGYQIKISIDEIEYRLGISHALVHYILPKIKHPITVNAANENSDYVFRTLGFEGNMPFLTFS